MKKLTFNFMIVCILIITGCATTEEKLDKFDFTGPNDASLIRGFNYTPASTVVPRHHIDTWMKYDESIIEFDLDLAKSLNLNQVRIFVPYQIYTESEDKEILKANLRHFTRACHERGIGVMPVVGSGAWVRDTTLRSTQAREWVEFLVEALSEEPGLKMWDAMNEPDWPTMPELVRIESDNAKFMANTFRELDPNTPVTIGWAFVDGMIEAGDYVDVLQFHDYMQTKEQIRDNIKRAKEYATQVNKPLINGEMGCIARANPYDITLKEHMDANVGWYIWELMIVRGGWGTVHGVFYEDGTVRDPSIAAAMMGYFRKRTGDILPAITDNEGWITKVIDQGTTWLNQPDASWDEGLNIAETAAHLMEAGELVAMRIPPTWEVNQLRTGGEDMPALKELLERFIETLQPYMVEEDQE